MSRHTENREELLKVHGEIDLIKQKLDTLENNHLAHMKKDIDRILYILGAVGLAIAQKTFRALDELEEYDRIYVEQNKIVIKFECRPIEIIVPPPKPKTPA